MIIHEYISISNIIEKFRQELARANNNFDFRKMMQAQKTNETIYVYISKE